TDCRASCMVVGLVVSGSYSTVSIALAKFTDASRTPGSALTVLSELAAHPAQVMFKTGNDSFIAVCLCVVAIAYTFLLVTDKGRHKRLIILYTISDKSCKISLYFVYGLPFIFFTLFKIAR